MSNLAVTVLFLVVTCLERPVYSVLIIIQYFVKHTHKSSLRKIRTLIIRKRRLPINPQALQRQLSTVKRPRPNEKCKHSTSSKQ
jgi:hypothetical protein